MTPVGSGIWERRDDLPLPDTLVDLHARSAAETKVSGEGEQQQKLSTVYGAIKLQSISSEETTKTAEVQGRRWTRATKCKIAVVAIGVAIGVANVSIPFSMVLGCSLRSLCYRIGDLWMAAQWLGLPVGCAVPFMACYTCSDCCCPEKAEVQAMAD